MKKSANGNMYEVALGETWELFGDHLYGSRKALVCVLSEHKLDDASYTALSNSAAALGYGKDACTFVSLCAENTLDSHALFLLVEGLDPLCIIAADKRAAQALSQTYHCEVLLGQANRVFGRSCVAFRSFPDMLSDPQSKQVAWALLKRLPKLKER